MQTHPKFSAFWPITSCIYIVSIYKYTHTLQARTVPGEHMGVWFGALLKGTSAAAKEVNWHLFSYQSTSILWSTAGLEPATLRSPCQVSTDWATAAPFCNLLYSSTMSTFLLLTAAAASSLCLVENVTTISLVFSVVNSRADLSHHSTHSCSTELWECEEP